MAQRVLVTGGNGFIASWCIVRLMQRGYLVRTTLRSLAKEPSLRAAIGSEYAADDRLDVCEADLDSDHGWDLAVAGCDHVLHVASPLGGAATADPDSLLRPAREGALRVLRAATKAGVDRVVMTSAAATARAPRSERRTSDETVWADPADQQFDAYRRSKILAERAAWDLIAECGARTSLTTILPGAVFGPALSIDRLGSVRIIRDLLAGRPPLIPRIGFHIVDVRDVADLHIQAMVTSAAAGERFLAAGEFMWLSDVAVTLHSRLGAAGRNVSTRRLPSAIVRGLAPFSPLMRSLLHDLDREYEVDTGKARRVLGFAPRPAVETIVDCANSLLR